MSSNLKGLRRGDKRIIRSCNSLVGSSKRSLFSFFFPVSFFWILAFHSCVTVNRCIESREKRVENNFVSRSDFFLFTLYFCVLVRGKLFNNFRTKNRNPLIFTTFY